MTLPLSAFSGPSSLGVPAMFCRAGRIPFLVSISLLAGLVAVRAEDAARRIIVITDLEPDDRMALHLLAARFRAPEIAFVGTTVMHAGRKALLARRLLGQLGLAEVPVFSGPGGEAGDYPDIVFLTCRSTVRPRRRGDSLAGSPSGGGQVAAFHGAAEGRDCPLLGFAPGH